MDDILIQGDPSQRVYLDELHLHRGETQVMDVGDAVPEGASLTGKWNTCWSEPNQADRPSKKAGGR